MPRGGAERHKKIHTTVRLAGTHHVPPALTDEKTPTAALRLHHGRHPALTRATNSIKTPQKRQLKTIA